MGKSFQLQLLPIFCVLSIAVLFTTIGCNGSQEKLDDNPGQEQTIATADSLVYRITIDDVINPSVSRLVRRGIEEAKKREADYLFIELETYGGLVVDADDIRTDLLNCPIPVIIYIQNNAASAGALISLACDSIYMNPSATIGAAAVVDQTGEVQAEKYQSYMRGKMRATAEANGRNPAIAEGMVDPSIVVPGISDSSKIITLTAQEATSEAINFCEGIAPDADSALRLAGLGEYTVQNHVPTSTDNVIGFFVRPVVSSLLLALIVIGIVLEFQVFLPWCGTTVSVCSDAYEVDCSRACVWCSEAQQVGCQCKLLELFQLVIKLAARAASLGRLRQKSTGSRPQSPILGWAGGQKRFKFSDSDWSCH